MNVYFGLDADVRYLDLDENEYTFYNYKKYPDTTIVGRIFHMMVNAEKIRFKLKNTFFDLIPEGYTQIEIFLAYTFFREKIDWGYFEVHTQEEFIEYYYRIENDLQSWIYVCLYNIIEEIEIEQDSSMSQYLDIVDEVIKQY